MGFAAQRSLYYRVYGLDDTILTSSPNLFSGDVEKIFSIQGLKSRESNDDREYWTNEDQIWISQALYDIDGRSHGRIDVLFMVQYDYMQALRQLGHTYSNIWYYLILFFSFIGIACGISANLFVMRRLKVMNNVTSVWCQGNLSPRIPVNDKSNDILSSHSRKLNLMADDLQSLFDLRYRAAIAEERGRVARELHDTVKQNLFALKLQIAAIKQKNCDSEISESIDEARKIIQESQNDIMIILAQLSSSMSGQRGFYERLAVLSENMRRRYHLKTVWEVKEEVSLSPGEEMTVTRIAQEVMANAARHGRATRIVMNAVKRNGMMQWTIRDNGSGFQQDKAVLSSGLGLIFLRQRAWDLPEGEFTIGGHPDGGTEVKI